MNHSFHLGPSSTHPYLKILLAITGALSLFSSRLIPYLALSLQGIEKLFLWQLATYPLIHPFPIGLFQLLFNLYLIWTFGSYLIERMGAASFFSLYFGAASFAGAASLLAMKMTYMSAPLMGTTPIVLASLVSWVLFNADARLLLFFTLPLKALHLILGLIGIALILDLTNSDWVHLFANIGAVLFGYLFTVIISRIYSPFLFLRSFERRILRLLEKINSVGKKERKNTKIYDIKSGSPVLDDEQFMDAMLAKISLYGENSLTPEEKKRMDRISKKK